MTIAELRREKTRLERELESVNGAIAQAERQCRHQWGEIKYKPIEHPGYQFHGDPPGTMGVDRQLPCYIPSSTTKVWERTCLQCGKVETTSATKRVQAAGSIPGTTAHVDAPQFNDDRRW
jgi:hypothetical protein